MTRFHFLLSAAFGLLTLTAAPTLAQTVAPAAAPTAVRPEHPRKSPDEQAAAMTKRMTRELRLTSDQEAKVAALNTQLTTDLGQVRGAEKAQRGERREKAQSIRAAYDANLKAALSAEQYAIYEKERAEREQKQHARQAGRRAAKGKGSKVPPGPGPGPAQQ